MPTVVLIASCRRVWDEAVVMLAWAGAVALAREAHLRRKRRAEDGAPRFLLPGSVVLGVVAMRMVVRRASA